jgi:hypothetical protein
MFGRSRRAQAVETAASRFRAVAPQLIAEAFCEPSETVQRWDMFTCMSPAGPRLNDGEIWLIALTDTRVIWTPILFFRDPDIYGTLAATIPYNNLLGCDHIPNLDWKSNNLPAHTLIIRYARSVPPLQFYSLGLPRNGVEAQLTKVVQEVQVIKPSSHAEDPTVTRPRMTHGEARRYGFRKPGK